jgi:hypothetical protein
VSSLPCGHPRGTHQFLSRFSTLTADLERFSQRRSDPIAAVADVVDALGGGIPAERGGEERTDVVKGTGPSGPEECFQLGEGEFDRIEVGAVGRKKAEMGADGFNRGAHLRLFVHRQVVEDDDVPGAQRGHQDLIDIGEEGRIVDRAVEDRRRAQPLEPQGGNDGVRLPMAARRVVVKPHTARAAAIPPQQVGRHAAFIEKHILAHVAQRLPGAPLPPGGGDIRASLLVGVYRFF